MQRAKTSCWRASNPILGLSLLQRSSAQKQKRERRAPARSSLRTCNLLTQPDITRSSMHVFQSDAILEYTCAAKLAGAVDARSHALTVSPNMKRVRCAGQSSSVMQTTVSAG